MRIASRWEATEEAQHRFCSVCKTKQPKWVASLLAWRRMYEGGRSHRWWTLLYTANFTPLPFVEKAEDRPVRVVWHRVTCCMIWHRVSSDPTWLCCDSRYWMYNHGSNTGDFFPLSSCSRDWLRGLLPAPSSEHTPYIHKLQIIFSEICREKSWITDLHALR